MEVLLEDLLDQLDQRAGDLDTGRAASHDDEVQDPVVDEAGLAVGGLEQRQQVVADPYGVLEVVQREGVLARAVDAEVVGRGTGGHHEVVERHRALGAEGDGVAVPVDADDLVLAEQHPLLATEDPPDDVADVGGVQAGGGDLVEQRQEGVEVVAVDDGDVDVLALEPLGGRQAPEAGAHDDDPPTISHRPIVAWRQRRVHGVPDQGAGWHRGHQ